MYDPGTEERHCVYDPGTEGRGCVYDPRTEGRHCVYDSDSELSLYQSRDQCLSLSGVFICTS